MNGFNPDIKASADGEAQPRMIEAEERLPSLEERITLLSEQERDELYLDALNKLNEAEEILHTINRINTASQQDKLF